MKKLIMILTLAICTVVSIETQAVIYNGNFHGNITGGNDTLTDAANDTTVFEIKGAKHAITLQHNVTKISGTVAGVIYLEGTIDTGASPVWVLIETDTLTDATNVYSSTLTVGSWVKYRVRKDMSGTQVSWHRSYLMIRQD